MLICCIFKLKDSFNRFKLSDEIKVKNNIELEFIEKIEELQEKIAYKKYDLAILDEKVWWKDDALRLLQNTEVSVIQFTGDFEKLNHYVCKNIDIIEKAESRMQQNQEEEKNNVKYVYITVPNENEEKIEDKKVEIKEVEKIIEKPVIIEKEIEKKVTVEVISNSTIAVISSCSTGKSFITSNLSHCFSDRGYNTSVINLDKGYSANILYGINNSEERALKNINKYKDKDIPDIIDKAYIVNKNLKIFTNELYSNEKINEEQFIKILDVVQAHSDITLIDCGSEYSEILNSSIRYSNTVLFVFDIDEMHNKLNLNLIQELNNKLNFKKTIAVINNTFPSDQIKRTRDLIKDLNKEFKDIVSIKNAGAAAYDSVFTSCAYFETDDLDFKKDMENLLESMRAKEKKKSFFERFLKI
ncbi:ParA family protein [Clostridium botulinum]|uniref:ParA family protein n=1 Tax=Clostridium botulinum TaxID=1491 RepID=UPI0004CFFE91|nr:ParA family protein [Clostridium botulinum]